MNDLQKTIDQGNQWISSAHEWLITYGINILINILTVIIILLISKYVVVFIRKKLKAMLQKSPRVDDMLKELIVSVVGKVLWVIVLIMVLGRIGLDIGPLIAGLGVSGFILGFAFQESLSNLAAGVMIALNRPFGVGDYIDAGGIAGSVKAMDMMAVTLTSPDNRKIIVPNKSIWGSAITNFTALETRRVDMAVGISYGSDISKAKKVILDTIFSFEEVLQDPAPTIEVVGLGDSSVNLVVRPWVKTGDYWKIFFAAYPKVKEALDANGISIPFPQMDVHHYGLDKHPENK